MTTLYDAILQTAMFSGVCVSGVSSGGDESSPRFGATLIDVDRHENDNYFNAGTLFIQSGTFRGLSRRIEKYSLADKRFEFSPAFEGIIPAGVRYTAVNQSREMLVQAVNQALLHMGLYTAIDESMTGDSFAEYDLPDDISNIVKIDEMSTGGGFTPVKTWREYAGKLYLEAALSGGNPLRIYYNKLHDTVSQDGDIIDPAFHLTRIAWTATYFYELRRLQYKGTNDEKENALFINAQQQMLKQERIHLVRKTERSGNMARY